MARSQDSRITPDLPGRNISPLQWLRTEYRAGADPPFGPIGCMRCAVVEAPIGDPIRRPRVVGIGRQVFQGLLDQRPTPERCVEAFRLQRTRFELIAERKLRRRQLTDDGNVEITGRDLCEKMPSLGQGSLFKAVVSHR